MNALTARTSLKRRLSIDDSNTEFDNQIDEFVLSGVARLYPIAEQEVVAQTKAVTVDEFGETSVDLSTLTAPCLSARRVEASTGSEWYPATETYHHGVLLYVRELSMSVTSLKIYGVTTYVLSTVPTYYEQAVIWYAMSEFFDMLASNKTKYNIYVQANAARAVDNMQDLSEYYEQKANVYLNDRAQLYGVA